MAKKKSILEKEREGDMPDLNDLEPEPSELELDEDEDEEDDPELVKMADQILDANAKEIEEQTKPLGPESPKKQEVVIRVEGEKPRIGRPRKAEAITKELNDANTELDDIMRTLDPGTESGIKVVITRFEPKIWKQRKIDGYLGQMEPPIDVDTIKSIHGGGTYDIKIFAPRRKPDGTRVGAKVIWGKRIIISGDPIPIRNLELRDDDGQVKNTDIVTQTLNQGGRMIDRLQEEKEQERKRNDELSRALYAKNNDRSGELELMRQMMSHQQETSRMQLEAVMIQLKNAQEESNRISREKEVATRQAIEESARASKEQMAPILQIIMAQSKDSEEKYRLMICQLQDSNKQSNDTAQKFMTMQMQMQQDSSKLQVEILKGELQRTSEQLSTIQKSNSGSLVDKLKEFKVLKGIMSDEGGSGSIADRIMDNLPEIAQSVPGIISSIGGLFSKGTPMIPVPPKQLPPVQVQQEPKVVNTEESVKKMDLTVRINVLKTDLEKAISSGDDPAKFYEEKIVQNFSDEELDKIASLPFELLITTLQQNLGSENSPILSVSGKEFIRVIHLKMTEQS